MNSSAFGISIRTGRQAEIFTFGVPPQRPYRETLRNVSDEEVEATKKDLSLLGPHAFLRNSPGLTATFSTIHVSAKYTRTRVVNAKLLPIWV